MRQTTTRFLLTAGFLLLSVFPAQARERLFGYCINPATGAHVANCTVTVFDSGTSSLSSIFDDNTGTSKANPFTADVNGFWFFYADDGRYDVRFSSGAPPISTPFSWGDVLLDERGTETCTETESQLAFAVVTCVDSTINANAGGDYSAASKVSYEPLRVDLNGRTKGQHILIGGAVNGYGIGDALFIGGDVFGYGGKFVTGTSQPTVEFAEINIRQGNKVFTAQVSGDPASGVKQHDSYHR